MRLGDFVYGQRSKEKAAGKKLGTAALAVFVVLMLSLASGTMSYGMLQLMHPLGLGAFVPAMFYMAASVLTLITAVGYSRALLFASRDLDTLLSMPVSHLTLLLSKLAGLYVYELIFLAVLFVPAYITYFIVAGFTVSGLFTLLVGVLFGPLIPLALGLLVAFLFGLVMRRMKRRNIIQIVFFLVFFAAYMYLMSNSDAIFDFIGNAGSDFWNALTNAYFPAALLYNAVSGDLLSLLGFAVLNALPMLLVIALLSKCFLKMTALLKQSHKSAKFTMKHQKSSGLFGALLKKEFQRFTGSATYMLNCGLGVVLLLGLTVACFFIGDDILAEITASITELPIFCYAVTMMLFTSTLATTTSVSVTLEGRALWVLKTAPVPTTTILAAKTAVNLILYLPTLLIAVFVPDSGRGAGDHNGAGADFEPVLPQAGLRQRNARHQAEHERVPIHDDQYAAHRSVFCPAVCAACPLFAVFRSAGLRLRPCPRRRRRPALLCPAKLGREEIRQLAGIDVLSADYGKFFRKFAITYCNLRRDGV